jgi:hypothetical protein
MREKTLRCIKRRVGRAQRSATRLRATAGDRLERPFALMRGVAPPAAAGDNALACPGIGRIAQLVFVFA